MRRFISRFFRAIALSVLTISPVWADFDSGVTAYASGDFDAAVREFSLLAATGDKEGQYYLGLLYEEGQGVPKKFDEAVSCYTKAAKQGYVDAFFALGEIYISRSAPQKNRVLAYHWLEMAAKYGHPRGNDEFERNKKLMTAEQIDEAIKLSFANH
jgi:TPR repeat protein